MKKFFKEFKAFITKGNVFDLAVGMIIATAFNKIVSSMVNDIIMPLVTYATGAASLEDLSIPLRTAIDATTGETVVTLAWKYGNFIQTIIDFLIIGLSVFIMVKLVTASREKFKDFSGFIAKESSKERRAEKKVYKAKAKEENKPFKEVWAKHLEEKAIAKAEEEKRLAEEKAKADAEYKASHPTQEELLMEIRDLLKKDK